VSKDSSADRRRADAWRRREGETVSGSEEERFTPDVVRASDMSGTACN